MKNYLLLFISLFLLNSCEGDKPTAMHPDFEKNKELAMKFIELHSSEDWEAQAALIHEDLDWAQPVYGSENYGKEGHVEAMKTMNQIPSPKSGKISRILIADGNAVEFGTPLLIIE